MIENNRKWPANSVALLISFLTTINKFLSLIWHKIVILGSPTHLFCMNLSFWASKLILHIAISHYKSWLVIFHHESWSNQFVEWKLKAHEKLNCRGPSWPTKVVTWKELKYLNSIQIPVVIWLQSWLQSACICILEGTWKSRDWEKTIAGAWFDIK